MPGYLGRPHGTPEVTGYFIGAYGDHTYSYNVGSSSAGGDINGDGCDDIIMGAPGTTHTAIFDQEGAVFVIYGALQ